MSDSVITESSIYTYRSQVHSQFMTNWMKMRL